MDNTVTKENSRAIGSKKGFAALLIIYLIVGIILAFYYKYEGLHSDAVAYFSIAHKYSNGDYADAVNGFWSPLFSWLLVPFIKAGLNPLHAARILNLISGFFLLTGIRSLSYSFDISDRLRVVMLITAVPVILSYTTIIFPDMILLCLLVYYLAIIFRADYPGKISNGIISGVIGATAYFSKNYAFPFFISHFTLFSIFHYIKNKTGAERAGVLKNGVAGMLVFALLSGFWIFAISSKYGHFAVGTAGSYNFSQIGPELPQMSEQPEPVLFMGLIEPSNKTAVSIMEDPTYMKVQSWSPFQSQRYFMHFAKHVLNNIYNIAFVFNKFSLLSGVIIIAYVILIFYYGRMFHNTELLYPLSTLILFSAGYTPFIIDVNNERYIWLANILLLLMCGHLLTKLFSTGSFISGLWRNILMFIFILSFLKLPLGVISEKPDRGERNLGLFSGIESVYDLHGRIASNDRWGDTLQIVYYKNMRDNRSQYLGMPKKGQSDDALLNELKVYDIDYYLVWENEAALPEFLMNKKDITGGGVPGLRVYSLK
ncbi:MAG: hypothetical protein HY808_01230 [Nitrospirae bacterium]|nr:hypothetical protein [Nitrospirota bacterium]